MDWYEVAASAILGYLIGSISFARIVAARVLPDQDISHTEYPVSDEFSLVGDGVSPGAVGRRAGSRAGGLAALGDISKGALAAGLLWIVFGRQAAAVAGVAAVLGHVAPIWHRFEGGFGQSPIIGSSLVLSPLSVPFAVISGTATSWLVAEFMVGGILWPLFLIGWGVLASDGTFVAYAVAVNVLYLWRMWPQLAQRYRYRRRTRMSRGDRLAELKESYRSNPFDQSTDTG